MTQAELAAHFDHTVLKSTATRADIVKLCAEAKTWGFASVCINPFWVGVARQELAAGPVKVCTVVGFPLGATTTADKAHETQGAVAEGADEIDMVLNAGLAKAGEWAAVQADIAAVVVAAAGRTVKVILETCALTNDEIVRACQASQAAGADFVKTSTGFGTGGATVEHVKLMKSTVGDHLMVKASGGIRTLADTLTLIAAGADRIGASAGVAIMQEFQGGKNEASRSGY